VSEAPPQGITEGNPAPFFKDLHLFPGNPANSLIQPERPENKNAGDSRRRECLKPPPQGITEGNPGCSFNRALCSAKHHINLLVPVIKTK